MTSKPTVEFAPAEHVSAFSELCEQFVREILELPWAMISDESRLSDFRSLWLTQGEDGSASDDEAAMARWDAATVARVQARYGVDDFSVDIRLVDLFARIERMPRAQ